MEQFQMTLVNTKRWCQNITDTRWGSGMLSLSLGSGICPQNVVFLIITATLIVYWDRCAQLSLLSISCFNCSLLHNGVYVMTHAIWCLLSNGIHFIPMMMWSVWKYMLHTSRTDSSVVCAKHMYVAGKDDCLVS